MLVPIKVILKSGDGDSFEVDEEVAMELETVRKMVETNGAVSEITLPAVSTNILVMVIAYCSKHVDAKAKGRLSTTMEAELKDWDASFVNVDHSTLLDLIRAATHLKIEGLEELACKAAANMIKGKNVEEIRQLFNIVNDLSPEEEDQIRRENQWAFE